MLYLAAFIVCGALAMVEFAGLHGCLRELQARLEEYRERALRMLGYGMPILGVTVLVSMLEPGHLALLASGLLYAAYLAVWKWRAQ